ncbi:MAG TPA: deoxyribodipyrimidine photo-lyase, partial [Pseudomonadales bacterium]|nr:deoxyribodipyrimidine photo-lyase [Pseudomonadales bacterium]
MSQSSSLLPRALLPEALRERATALNRLACDEHGHCVLYWMRTAMRAHDNPALDAAVSLANVLGVPVLVYQALSERYPYASDRHHRFILEGARDVQAECAARAIPYVFHLERPGHRGDYLRQLAAGAAAVVTESFPWTPIRAWTRAVAAAAPVGMIGVDAACLVPMRTVPADARDRAFRFRSATAERRREALAATPADLDPQVEAPLPALPFEPLDLADADLAELVAACEIDHLVGPVPHTPGGSRAAYDRWNRFRDGPLRRYDARRNDPLADGVSRMSPYLHYGQVSPFRIAREAHDLGGRGAEKFLDELLVWREMSWAWCFHTQDHDSLAALPDWARETLEEHAGDPRPRLLDGERLARGRSGDALWDAAQRGLLIHGELHNNLRMTWGKMLPQWSPDPATALARLIDLNHRYALDGRDPNSYGGLLWCLGGFDRPFDPPRPVLGRVRPRDTATHARRLDVAAYAAHTAQAARPSPPRVAVIGAGMAGLVLGRTLDDHGWPVTLFDKGRQPGGRLATRRSRQAPGAAFDHGAASFRCTDPRLARHLQAWRERGLVRPWPDADGDRLTATDGAAGLAAHLAEDLEVHAGRRIVRIERDNQHWWLVDADDRRAGPFEALALNLPPAQAADLLRTLPASERGATGLDDLIAELDAVPMAPRWMALVRAPEARTDFALHVCHEGDIA